MNLHGSVLGGEVNKSKKSSEILELFCFTVNHDKFILLNQCKQVGKYGNRGFNIPNQDEKSLWC